MIKKLHVLFFSVIMIMTPIYAADWLTSFKMSDTNDFIICGGCAAHPDDTKGGFIMAGFYDPNHHGFAIRIDKYGNIVWKKDLLSHAAKSADLTDQGYLIAGNFGIIKLTNNGDFAWSQPEQPYSKLLCYIKKIGSTGSKYIVIGDDLSSSYIFDEASQSGSNLISLPGRFYEVKPDGDALIFSGEDASTSSLRLYKTYASNLQPYPSFGSNGLKTYLNYNYKFGSAIEVCRNGSGYLVACESGGQIKIIKVYKNTGNLHPSFNYTPTMNIAYAPFPPPGRKKSLGIKELDNSDVLLGGIYTNNSESDFFIQSVNSTGNTELYKRQFENLGRDTDM